MKICFPLRSAALLMNYKNTSKGGVKIGLFDFLYKFSYFSLYRSESLEIAESSHYTMPSKIVESFNYYLN